MQAFQDGLQEVQAYLKTGVTPPGFSVMPASPEQAPDEAAAKMGKRPGSAKARDDLSGGPGISKDAGRVLHDAPAASALVLLDNFDQQFSDNAVTSSYGTVCPFLVWQIMLAYLCSQSLTAHGKVAHGQQALQAR